MSALARRTFLTSLAASVAAPAILRSQTRPKRLPIAFSTLGCPAWSWKAILESADKLGYAALELRGIAGEMDLPKVPSWARARRDEGDLARSGSVSDWPCRACTEGEGRAREAADEGRRFIDLAQALSVPYVRMFGDKLPPDEPKQDVMKRVVDGFQQMAAHAKTAGVTVIIESHGDFTHSADLEQILKRSAHPFAPLGRAPYVRGRPGTPPTPGSGSAAGAPHPPEGLGAGGGRPAYVLVGAGEVPVKEQVKVLAGAGYKGFYCFEWEKKWHPEIEEPEVAFPHYAKTMRDYLAEAGVKTS
jgi:sugar phosphate isomerase/epimerase